VRKAGENTEEFGHSKFDWFKRFIALSNGTPRLDTIAKVMARLDPNVLQRYFFQRMSDFILELLEIKKCMITIFENCLLQKEELPSQTGVFETVDKIPR